MIGRLGGFEQFDALREEFALTKAELAESLMFLIDAQPAKDAEDKGELLPYLKQKLLGWYQESPRAASSVSISPGDASEGKSSSPSIESAHAVSAAAVSVSAKVIRVKFSSNPLWATPLFARAANVLTPRAVVLTANPAKIREVLHELRSTL